MKIAMCMSGQLRTISYTVEKMIKHIINPTDCDIFISIPRMPDNEEKLKYLDPVKNRIKVIDVWDDVHLDEKNYKSRPCGDVIMQRFLLQLYNRKKVIEAKNKYEKENNTYYKWTIVIRPDVFLETNHDIEDFHTLQEKTIYSCDHDHWEGLQDRLYFGTSDVIDPIEKRFDYLDSFYNAGGVCHAESYFLSTIEKFKARIAYTSLIVKLKRDPPFGDAGPFNIGQYRPGPSYPNHWNFHRRWFVDSNGNRKTF